MPLYSYQGDQPGPLPFRITLPNGFTRTDPNTFTAEEIAAAGFTGPYTEPPYDPNTQILNWVDGKYVVVSLPPPLPQPQWLSFSTSLMSNPDCNIMLSSLVQSLPGIYGGVIIGLQQASQGDERLFLSAWDNIEKAGRVSDTLRSTIYNLAVANNLPIAYKFLPPPVPITNSSAAPTSAKPTTATTATVTQNPTSSTTTSTTVPTTSKTSSPTTTTTTKKV